MRKNIFLLFLFLVPSIVIWSVENREESAKLSIQLADSLYDEGQNEYALREYLDYTYNYPHGSHIYHAWEKIAQIQKNRQEWVKATKIYENLYFMAGPGEKGVEYLYQQARLYDLMGFAVKAQHLVSQILVMAPESESAEKARLLIRIQNLWDASHTE